MKWRFNPVNSKVSHWKLPAALAPPLLGLALVGGLAPQGLGSEAAEAAGAQTAPAAAPAGTDAAAAAEADAPSEAAASEAAEPAAEPAAAEPATSAVTGQAAPAAAEPLLRFSFSGASWREVLNWLAEEADLALHVGDVPTGSFTYFDPAAYTADEAIARVNLFLIPQGYAAVRRDQLLSVIGLGDPRSLQQLDALATLTTIDALEGRSDHEVVKCIVPLGEATAEEATAELSPLMLMVAPVVLPKSNQMIVTETVGKVKSVLAVLQAMNAPPADSVVQRFKLDHVDLETVMLAAGAHLGLSPGATEGSQIRISTDLTGKSLFVTGSQEKVDRLAALLKTIDVPTETTESLSGRTLRSHRVAGDNLQAVYDVLQTLLAGKSLRLSMQTSTSSIVALADAEVHEEIQRTIEEMQAPAVDFAVIDIHSLDPYFVVSLIGEMFAAPTTDPAADTNAVAAPKVDADAGNRRLFVRGTSEQIEQIRKMVGDLNPQPVRGESVRVLPLPSQQRRQVLEAAERFWRGDNRVLILPSSEDFEAHGGVIERVLHPDQAQDRPVSAPATPPRPAEEAFEAGARPAGQALAAEALVSLAREEAASEAEDETAGEAPNPSAAAATDNNAPRLAARAATSKIGRPAVAPIRGQLIPQGIMIQSDDVAALDQFESHLLEIAASSGQAPSPTVVYYLKYVSAEDAVKMLADLLDGGQTLAQTPAGTLVNANSARFPRIGLGSFTFNRDGMTTVTTGTATIVSDARLNRLIIQGTTEEVGLIDSYLKIIDKGSSMTSVETFGRSHVIELQHTKAADVAKMIQEAFPGRIASNAQGGQQDRGGDRGRRGWDRRRGDDGRRSVDDHPTRGREPELAVAVHESSNSLVITAPDALFAEVEQLVRSVDLRSEQVTEVIPAAAGVDLETILRTLNGDTTAPERGQRRGPRDNRPQRSR